MVLYVLDYEYKKLLQDAVAVRGVGFHFDLQMDLISEIIVKASSMTASDELAAKISFADKADRTRLVVSSIENSHL